MACDDSTVLFVWRWGKKGLRVTPPDEWKVDVTPTSHHVDSHQPPRVLSPVSSCHPLSAFQCSAYKIGSFLQSLSETCYILAHVQILRYLVIWLTALNVSVLWASAPVWMPKNELVYNQNGSGTLQISLLMNPCATYVFNYWCTVMIVLLSLALMFTHWAGIEVFRLELARRTVVQSLIRRYSIGS